MKSEKYLFKATITYFLCPNHIFGLFLKVKGLKLSYSYQGSIRLKDLETRALEVENHVP